MIDHKLEPILLVDDEKDITNLLEEVLRRDGFENIYKAHNGIDAVDLCRSISPAVMILDVMMPGMDGLDVCKAVRSFTHCPILFLSSKNDEVDKILGLAIGGDDYITKPFSPREVVFRIKAQLRRQAYKKSDISFGRQENIKIGSLKIDPNAKRVLKNNEDTSLTAREYGMLLYLAENADIIISKERLYEQVWGEDSMGIDNTIMVHIRHLREKNRGQSIRAQVNHNCQGIRL